LARHDYTEIGIHQRIGLETAAFKARFDDNVGGHAIDTATKQTRQRGAGLHRYDRYFARFDIVHLPQHRKQGIGPATAGGRDGLADEVLRRLEVLVRRRK
jgi:hypothetical protein